MSTVSVTQSGENTIYTCGEIQLATNGTHEVYRWIVRNEHGAQMGVIEQVGDVYRLTDFRRSHYDYPTLAAATEAAPDICHGNTIEPEPVAVGWITPIGGDIQFHRISRLPSGEYTFGSGRGVPYSTIEAIVEDAWSRLEGDPLLHRKVAVNASEGTGTEEGE